MPRFTLPAGLRLDVTPDGLDIEFDGDIELEQDFGVGLHRVVAGGDLVIKLAEVTGSLDAGGTLRIQGDIAGHHLHGREIVLGRQQVRCTSISADERITIGAAILTVDAIVAPEIHLDPKASGRVTVIESNNDRGATKIKGGFSVADYDDMIGDADAFLAKRGLRRLGGAASDLSPRSHTPPSDLGPGGPPVDPGLVSIDEDPPPPEDPLSTEGVPEPQDTDTDVTEEEDIDDPLSLSLDDLEPLVERTEAQFDRGEVDQRLADALGRITACYEGTDLPPAVAELRDLVEERDYDALRQNITEVWNGLLGFHQKRGIRPHHQVTHAFNVIHGLVQS